MLCQYGAEEKIRDCQNGRCGDVANISKADIAIRGRGGKGAREGDEGCGGRSAKERTADVRDEAGGGFVGGGDSTADRHREEVGAEHGFDGKKKGV